MCTEVHGSCILSCTGEWAATILRAEQPSTSTTGQDSAHMSAGGACALKASGEPPGAGSMPYAGASTSTAPRLGFSSYWLGAPIRHIAQAFYLRLQARRQT